MTQSVDLGEVHIHILEQIHGAITNKETKGSTVILHFMQGYYLGAKAAEYLHQLLEAHPGIKEFYVKAQDGKELLITSVDGHYVNVFLPVSCGKFHMGVPPPLRRGKSLTTIFGRLDPPVVLPLLTKPRESFGAVAPLLPVRKPRESIGGAAKAPYDERRIDSSILQAKPTSKKPRARRGSLSGGVMQELKCKQQGIAVPAGPNSTRSTSSDYTFVSVPESVNDGESP
jgi:hypothetical protein